MRGWERIVVLLGLLLAGAVSAFAQIPLTGSGNPATAPATPLFLRTPRSTFEAFLDAMRDGDLAKARSTMVLDSILLPLRESEGNYRAKQLLFVIDRTKVVDLDKVSDQEDAETYVFSEYTSPTTKERIGEIAIVRQSDGGWRFSSESIQIVPALYRNLQDAPSKARLGVDEGDLAEPGQIGRSLAPAGWRVKVLVLELWQWAGLGALVGISALLIPLLRWLVRGLVRVQLPFYKESLSKSSERRLKSSLAALVLAEVWHSALPYIDLPSAVEAAMVFVLRLFSGAALAWLLTSLFDAIVDVAGHVGKQGLGRRTENILIPVVRKFGKTLILLGTVLFVASAIGFNLAGVIAGLGIGGLVVALAAKDSVENLFGSFTILFDMPFGIGDWVKIGDIDGVVEEINLRSTRIRTFADSVITLPNSNLIKASVENLGQRRYRRLQTTLGLEYGTPPERVDAFCRELRDLIANNPKTRKDTIRASFFDYGESSLKVKFDCYFMTLDYAEELELRHEMMMEIYRIAERLEVSFAFPSQTLYVRKDSPQLHEDAS